MNNTNQKCCDAGCHGEDCPVHGTESVEEWEERFEKEFLTPEGFWNKANNMYPFAVKSFIRHLLQERSKEGVKIDGETSDGYHTFNELYEFRKLYNAAFFNQVSSDHNFNVHKSKKHHDGEECFGGGWFIVMATLPTGQISNHYELKDWDLFDCEGRERAEEWDGHTAKDVAKRLTDLLATPHLSEENKK